MSNWNSMVVVGSFVALFGIAAQEENPEPARHVSVTVSAIAWPCGYSELEWEAGGERIRAIVNTDLAALPPWLELRGKDNVQYSFLFLTAGRMDPESVREMIRAGEADAEGRPVGWPQPLPPLTATAQAVPFTAAAPNAGAEVSAENAAGIGLFLADFAANKERYTVDGGRRARDAAAAQRQAQARKEWLVLHPPQPPRLKRIEAVSPEKVRELRERTVASEAQWEAPAIEND